MSVISRNPKRNAIPGVSYHIGDISDSSRVHELVLSIRPSIIVHAACPHPTTASRHAYERIVVNGTRDLLTSATQATSVKAFIYTSSATMAAGPEHINLDEDTPLADTISSSHPYARCKAVADKMVLQANATPQHDDMPSLLTGCIRLPIVYGERDLLSIPETLKALEKN